LRWFKIEGQPLNFPPHYNVAPGQELPVVRLHPESAVGLLR
jgi:putative SOS response-associated peptidase YedK